MIEMIDRSEGRNGHLTNKEPRWRIITTSIIIPSYSSTLVAVID